MKFETMYGLGNMIHFMYKNKLCYSTVASIHVSCGHGYGGIQIAYRFETHSNGERMEEMISEKNCFKTRQELIDSLL